MSTMTCPRCGLDGGPFSVDEATVLAATHDRLFHGGARTACAVTALTVAA